MLGRPPDAAAWTENTKVTVTPYGRVLAPGLGALDPRLPEEFTARSSLAVAWRGFEKALDDYMEVKLIAA